MFNFFKTDTTALHEQALEIDASLAPTYDIDAMGSYLEGYDGSKFDGGYGDTEDETLDYWMLRARSAELFNSNLYARGLIRRLVTNEINTGLTPEACPDDDILGVEEDTLGEWTEDVETRFHLWGTNPKSCSYLQDLTFGQTQEAARRESLVAGDVLCVLRKNPATGMTTVELVRGSRVVTDGSHETRASHTVEHGVELDKNGRHVAFHVKDADGNFTRVPAVGPKTGRLQAWLVYGTDRRLGEVRGVPLLGIVLQSLKEIDRYRDSAQRKAVINSMLAMFVKKSEDKPGTRPISAGATRRDSVAVTDPSGAKRQFNIQKSVPGMVMEELQHGEEPVAFGANGTDVNFGPFEEAMLQSVAWANEMPPEIMRLAFSSNYSASQAALNEFKIYLNKIWSTFGANFCRPVYQDWLINENLAGRVVSPGLLDAWRDPTKITQFTSWTDADWYGSIKPSTDMKKLVQASKLALDEGWTTNSRESRAITGTKFTKNAKRLKRENELKVEAMTPLAEFKKEYGFGVEQTEEETT